MSGHEQHGVNARRHPWPIEINFNFHPKVFWEQLFYHVFYPFSLPIFLAVHGMNAARNQHFVANAALPVFFSIILPCLAWALVVCWFVFEDHLTKQGITAVELAVSISLIFMHRVFVSIKHAFLGKEQYKWFLTCEDPDVALKFANKQQMISGWLFVKEDDIEDELEIAQVRMQVDLSKSFFSVPRSGFGLVRWERLLGGNSRIAADTTTSTNSEDPHVEQQTTTAPERGAVVDSASDTASGTPTSARIQRTNDTPDEIIDGAVVSPTPADRNSSRYLSSIESSSRQQRKPSVSASIGAYGSQTRLPHNTGYNTDETVESGSILGRGDGGDGVIVDEYRPMLMCEPNGKRTEQHWWQVDGFTFVKSMIKYGISREGTTKRIAMPLGFLSSIGISCVGGLSRELCATLSGVRRSNSTTVTSLDGKIFCGHHFFGDDAYGAIFVATNMIIASFFFLTVMGLFSTMVFDLWRRRNSFRRLGRLLEAQDNITFRGQSVVVERKFPSINLSDPAQVRVWTLCRLVLHDYASQRLHRMTLYSGASMLPPLMLLVWFMLNFVREFQLERVVLRTDAVVHFAGVYGFVGVMMAAVAIFAGADANLSGEMHRKFLIERRIKLHSDAAKSEFCGLVNNVDRYEAVFRDALRKASDSSVGDLDDISTNHKNIGFRRNSSQMNDGGSHIGEKEEGKEEEMDADAVLQECEAQLDAGAQLVDVLSRVRPFTFMGIRAESAVAVSLLTLSGSVSIVLIQEIFL